MGKVCCANCKHLIDLWWFTYNPDGTIEDKHYGKACIALGDVAQKVDKPDICMCEVFVEKGDI